MKNDNVLQFKAKKNKKIKKRPLPSKGIADLTLEEKLDIIAKAISDDGLDKNKRKKIREVKIQEDNNE